MERERAVWARYPTPEQIAVLKRLRELNETHLHYQGGIDEFLERLERNHD